MARKRRKHYDVYHCDGYYFENVCSSRGEPDANDVRYNRKGELLPPRWTCLSNGISPFTGEECLHCIEMKRLFRKKPRRRTEVIDRNRGF